MRDAPSCSCTVDDRRIPSFLLDNVLRRLARPPRRFLERYLSLGDRVADLGCGPGHFTVPITEIIGDAGHVFAIDLDPTAIARLRRRIASRDVGRIVDARVASAADIDFIDTGSLDFVLAEGLLCCMKDHVGAMEQILRILRPAGTAWLSVMKLGRPEDPRSVTATEWTSILNRTRVLESGEGPFSRWALVGPLP